MEIGEFEPEEHDGGIMDFRTYISNEVTECVEKAKSNYPRKPKTGYACDLCPIRSFDRRDRLRKHLEISHGTSGPGAASPRALRLALALYKLDQIRVSAGLVLSFDDRCGSYLVRASKKIAEWVTASGIPNQRAMSGEVAQIDRHVMLVLTGKCPIYAVRANEGAIAYRRVGGVYYD